MDVRESKEYMAFLSRQLLCSKAVVRSGKKFRSVKYQTYRDEERHSGGADAEKFENISRISNCAGKRDANYDNVDDHGIAAVGTKDLGRKHVANLRKKIIVGVHGCLMVWFCRVFVELSILVHTCPYLSIVVHS